MHCSECGIFVESPNIYCDFCVATGGFVNPFVKQSQNAIKVKIQKINIPAEKNYEKMKTPNKTKRLTKKEKYKLLGLRSDGKPYQIPKHLRDDREYMARHRAYKGGFLFDLH